MKLTINGSVTPVDGHVTTWGDLLSVLDGRVAATGDVLTCVHIDGTEEDAFRDPALAGRSLSTMHVVDVETGTPEVLARRCLGDAALALSSLSDATRGAADGFRGDDITQARHALEQVSQGLLAVLKIVAAAGLALRRELDVADGQGRSISSLTTDLDRVIRDIVEGQQSEDWLQVADILEHELDPMLKNWHDVLVRIATT